MCVSICMRWVGVLLAILCVSGCRLPEQADTSPIGRPGIQTEKQFRLELLDFNKRRMSQAYLKIGERDPQWDALVVELLDAQAIHYTNSGVFHKALVPGGVAKERRLEIVNQLRALKCTDPYVRYVMLVLVSKQEKGYLNSALDVCRDLLDSKYSAYEKWSACWYFSDYLKRQGRHEEADALVGRLVELVCESIDNESMSLADQYFMFRMLEDEIKGEWLPRWKAVCERIEGKQVANPWLANAIIGFYHTEAAWDLRSHSYDYTEQHEGWTEYVEHLRIAREHLARAWELAPDFPVVSYKLIKISVCQSTGEERLWFDRAVDAQVDYYPAYSQYLWSLKKRWGGSMDQMYAFGVECLETNRFDTRIPEIFYEAMIKLHQEAGGYSYWYTPGVYENFLRYYEAKKHEPDGRSNSQWWDSMKAAIGWRLGHYEDAAKQMESMGDSFNIKAFSKLSGEPVLAASEVYVRLNPDASEVADRASQLWGQQRPRRAAELLDTVLRELAADDPARVYLENKSAQSRWKHRKLQGVWADLLGRADMGGWDVERGQWSMDPQGRLVGHSLNNGLAVVCRLKFGYRYEMKGTLECLQAPDPQEANGGVLMAYQVDGSSAYHRDVLLFPNKSTILAARTFKYASESYPAELNEKNTFHLQVWDRHVRLAVNDVVVIEHRRMPRRLSSTIYRFALGGYYRTPGATIRYDELKIRCLNQRPGWTYPSDKDAAP